MIKLPSIAFRALVLGAFGAACAAGFAADEMPASAASNVAFVQGLALSPDGGELLFVWEGDVWRVPSAGGDARRLTSHPAADHSPVWSPDGGSIAFASSRHGNDDIFVMDRSGRNLRRLTWLDSHERPTSWFADGSALLATSGDGMAVDRNPRIIRVPLGGATHTDFCVIRARNPVLSPDGSALVFETGAVDWERKGYHGSANRDLWVWEVGGPAAKQLTTFDGHDGKALWSIHERTIFFLSERSGSLNVWAMTTKAGEAGLWQVTRHETDNVRDFSISRDGAVLVYTWWDKVYCAEAPEYAPVEVPIVAAEDFPEPMVTYEALTSDADDLAVSPGGKELVISVRGDIFVVPTKENRPTRAVTSSPARDRMPAWSADGRTIFFVSDREDGIEQVYRAEPVFPPKDEEDAAKDDDEKDKNGETPKGDAPSEEGKAAATASGSGPGDKPATSPRKPGRRVGQKKPGSKPSAAKQSDDTKGEGDKKKDEEVTLEDRELWRAVDFTLTRLTHSGVAEFTPTPSPDGTKLAFVRGRGDLVILDLEKNEEKVLFEWWDTPQFEWSPDSRWIAYAREDHEFNVDVWIVPADGSAPAYNVTQHPDHDGNPHWSGDGKILAFSSKREGDNGDLYFVFLDKKLDEATGLELDEYFEEAGKKYEERVKALDKTLKEAREKKAEAASGKDGKEKAGGKKSTKSKKASSPGPEKKIDDSKTEKDGAAAKEKKDPFAVEIDFDLLYRRVRRVTSLPGDQYDFALSADGATYLFSKGENTFATIKWNGKDLKELSVKGRGGSLVRGRDGKRFYFLETTGKPASVTTDGGDKKSHDFRAAMKIDRDAERAQKFDDAARTLGRLFYHPTMKGLDWAGLSAKYRALAVRTRTSDAFNEVFSMLMGELNASHLGMWGGPEPDASKETTGRLGIELDPAHTGPGARVAAVVPRSPADEIESRLRPGDVILAVDGQPLGTEGNLWQRLVAQAGERVTLTVQGGPPAAPASPTAPTASDDTATTPTLEAAPAESAATDDASTTRTVFITPIATNQLDSLRYQEWVDQRRAKVEEWSGGRLAYCHIRGMGMEQVETFERDLYAVAHGKDALVLDVRNNGGGWTADILLTIFETRDHATTAQRGGQKRGYPQDRRLTYAWTKPAILLCNQNSFSNAEIFSHAWKTLGRGKLVGVPTFGGVISTGGTRLIDGTFLRLPGRGWYVIGDDRDMENNGAVPDLIVPMGPNEQLSGEDTQLRAAVEALLKELPAPTP